ncbi:winged helix-turn-helix domain-containing protein [Streptomyces sp. NPDC001220]
MAATAGSRTGRVRVLIVDDEPGLTELLSAAVADAGRRPYPAPDGQTIWSTSFDGGENLVEVCISSLRRKIDRGRTPMIHTVRGMGYVVRAVEDGR